MKVYPQEKAIANLIKNNTSASINLTVQELEDTTNEVMASIAQEGLKNVSNKKILKVLAAAADQECPDFLYGSAILVSTVMNDNDDVFLAEETWKARHTPVNTPYNEEHASENIIGHIIGARCLDEEGSVLPESDEAPEYFDIEADFVMYKSIFPEIASNIKERSALGMQGVSMECRFNNFDYAIFESEGNALIVERNDRTAFLTKFLRSYGGTGVYNNKRVGRVLRNMRFTGMANTKNPANPGSKYTKLNYEKASASFVEEGFIFKTKGNTMVIENIDKAKEVIASLEKELADTKAASTAAEASKTELTSKNLELTNANKAFEVSEVALKAELKLAKDELEKSVAELNTTKEQVNTLKAEVEAKTKELNEIHASAKRAERIAALKEVGLAMTDEELNKMVNIPDESFVSLVAALKSIKDKSAASTKTDEEEAEAKLNEAKASKDEAGVENTEGEGAAPSEDEQLRETAKTFAQSFRKINKDEKKSK